MGVPTQTEAEFNGRQRQQAGAAYGGAAPLAGLRFCAVWVR